MAIRLRPGLAPDLGFLSELAREAFEHFGDYDRLLPEWARTPGIELTVAEENGQRVGLTLLGFFEEASRPPGEQGFTTTVADLLAIAVAGGHRRRGVGRQLLQAAMKRARELARVNVVCALRLTVAEDNAAARQLFEAAGFQYVPQHDGHYPKGQRALRMELPLEPE
jgi:ribosomal protein S18 acetylase RimI-like enzyme